jgi:hypothetical protein
MVYRLYLLIFLPILVFGANLDTIAKKIYQNECGSNPKNLIHWNKGESFASLGIGHFIWYSKKNQEKFVESFPPLIEFLEQNGVKVPNWLKKNSPWNNKNEMNLDPRYDKLKKFLIDTMDLQAKFMSKRLEKSLPDLVSVNISFQRVTNTKNGYYPLIDYLNFKGLGNSDKEKYRGEGWGLIQVLKCMPNKGDAKSEFRECAKFVLKNRVKNSPPSRNEKRWLKGWYNRIDSYI